MSAEKAKTVRQALKAELGLNSRQVSVQSPHYGSIRVVIKTGDVSYSKVKEIAKRVEVLRVCEASGEILGGGNTFVEVGYDEEVVRQVAETPAIGTALEAARSTKGALVPVEGHAEVSLSYYDGDFLLWRGNYPQRLWATGSPVHDARAIARALLTAN